MQSFTEFKKKALKDPELKRLYDEMDLEFQLIRAIIRQRINKGVTQSELAKKVGTKQSAIARFEAGNSNPTLDFIQKLSRALNLHISVSA